METEEEKAAREAKELLESSTGHTDDTETVDFLRNSAIESSRLARQADERARNAEAELERLRRPAPPTPRNISAEEFFADPVSVIRSEITSQIAPLNEFSAQVRRDTEYNKLKNRFLADAQFGPAVQKLGTYLDDLMSKLEPTVENMRNSITQLYGQLALTNPEFFAPPKKDETPKEDTPPKMVTPPHLRPSGAPSASKEVPKEKTYTENERRLMREANMTPEQWEAAMNAPANLSGVRKK